MDVLCMCLCLCCSFLSPTVTHSKQHCCEPFFNWEDRGEGCPRHRHLSWHGARSHHSCDCPHSHPRCAAWRTGDGSSTQYIDIDLMAVVCIYALILLCICGWIPLCIGDNLTVCCICVCLLCCMLCFFLVRGIGCKCAWHHSDRHYPRRCVCGSGYSCWRSYWSQHRVPLLAWLANVFMCHIWYGGCCGVRRAIVLCWIVCLIASFFPFSGRGVAWFVRVLFASKSLNEFLFKSFFLFLVCSM